MSTKDQRISEVVSRLQEVAEETGSPSLWWQLGRLDVLESIVHVATNAFLDEYLSDALAALEQVEAERARAAETAKPGPFDEVEVQTAAGVLWLDAGTMARHEAQVWVAGRPDRRIKS
jgi:hypothetical protein